LGTLGGGGDLLFWGCCCYFSIKAVKSDFMMMIFSFVLVSAFLFIFYFAEEFLECS
jgi:hypothetical protein